MPVWLEMPIFFKMLVIHIWDTNCLSYRGQLRSRVPASIDRRGVGDKHIPCKPGFAGLIPAFFIKPLG